ncbi:hypothetical protein [Oenococcus sp.]|uniref:hypothetical protein n=1 Tax=Oenococcus sp. TaxID=1979414 RepID=UPI0039ED6818
MDRTYVVKRKSDQQLYAGYTADLGFTFTADPDKAKLMDLAAACQSADQFAPLKSNEVFTVIRLSKYAESVARDAQANPIFLKYQIIHDRSYAAMVSKKAKEDRDGH